MEPDNLQQAWRAQSSQTRVTVDADLLLKEVQRSQGHFQAMIFWRDFREAGVALVMLPLWFYMGITLSLPWTWYLTAPALVWVIGFILVDRMRHKRKPSEPGDPLLKSVKESLTQVEHQIWLLRNVFWWYLLPSTISILAFFADVTLSLPSKDWLEDLGRAAFFGFLSAFLFAVHGFIYFLNQRAVRTQLEPRRQELLTLLASLGDETTSEVSGEYAILMGTRCDAAAAATAKSAARKIFKSAALVAVIVFLMALTFIALASGAFDSAYLIYCSVTLLLAWGIYRVKSAALVSVMFLLAALAFIALAGGVFDSSYDGAPRSDGPAGASLAGLVTELRKEKKLVGLAAMVMVDGQVTASAAHGERKKGSGVPIELGDRWHLGSITKSFTATMIARLIESGQMKWTDTIGERFPDASIHESWKSVTLQQLLTHTSGAPANFSMRVKLKEPALGLECTQERRKAVMDVIAEKPAYPPGEKHVYSNVGYTIAGAMAETATGVSWEDLVKREVFKPLELSDAGFGPPKSPSATLEQPRGHLRVLGWKVSADDDMDNTPIMGPAGAVHMTLSNLCKYATEHLRGELGAGKLLAAETYKRLHTPKLQDYACGWVVKRPTSEIPYTVYWHNGSNTMWYALVVFIPKKNMVVAVTSNDGDIEKAEAAAWEIVKASVKQINAGGVPPGLEPQQHPRLP